MDKTQFDFTLNDDDMIHQVKAVEQKIYFMVEEVSRKVIVSSVSSFKTKVLPLINVFTYIEPLSESIEYLFQFHPSKKVRDFASETYGKIRKFYINWNQRKDIYDAMNLYYTKFYMKEKGNLTDEENRYVDHMMRDYKREGLHLNDPEIKKLKQELSDLSIKYSKNVNEVTTHFMFTKEELDGMDDWFSDEKKSDDGKYKVTLKYPDYRPVMKYCTNEQVRKKVYVAYQSRCFDTNIPLLEKSVKIRSVLAKLLGYSNHADYVTEVKIIKNSYNAIKFMSDLNTKFTELYHNDLDELLKFAITNKKILLTKKQLDPWDFGFYTNLYRKEKMNIDSK